MPRKRKLNEEMSAKKIYDHFVSNDVVDNISNELYAAFQQKGSYKYLKNIGLHQISTASEWIGSPYDDVQKTARMHYDKIKEVASKIEEEMEEIIKEKFEGAFRNTLKEEILKFINNSNSAGLKNRQKSTTVTIKPLTVGNLALKEEETENAAMEKSDSFVKCEEFLDTASFASVSSVHTSDLSSFDDEISISSDEETGRERKLVSLKFAQEELDRCKANKVVETHDVQNHKRAKSLKSEIVIRSEDSTNEYENFSPRRIRKPNLKYFSSDILSPFEIDLESSPFPLNNGIGSVPRKRGRPRKNPLS